MTNLSYNLGIPSGDILGFRDVGLEVVELNFEWRLVVAAEHVLADAFPVAEPHGLLAAVACEFAVEEFARLLFLTEERGSDADAVNALGHSATGEIEQGGQPVLKPGAIMVDAASLHFARPLDNERHADAALVKRALEAAQRFHALEEIVVHLQLEVRGAIVGGENNDGVFLEAEFFDEVEHVADVAVHARDHRGVCGAGGEVRRVAVALAASEWRVIPFLREVRLEFIVGHVQRDMRNDGGVIKKERLGLVLADERERLLVDAIRRVVLPLEDIVAARILGVGTFRQRGMAGNRRLVFQHEFLFVAPKVRRVIAVGNALAIVTEKSVEALMNRITRRARPAKTPLAKCASSVPLLAQQLSNSHLDIWNRMLPLRLHGLVVAHKRMPRMLAGHQHTARRRTHGVAGVIRCEPHTLTRKLVEMRRLDFLLPVRSQLCPTEIIGHN